jgi:hypothetical protein
MSAPQARRHAGPVRTRRTAAGRPDREWRHGDLQTTLLCSNRVPAADWLICPALLSLERSACGVGPIVNGNQILLSSSEAPWPHITWFQAVQPLVHVCRCSQCSKKKKKKKMKSLQREHGSKTARLGRRTRRLPAAMPYLRSTCSTHSVCGVMVAVGAYSDPPGRFRGSHTSLLLSHRPPSRNQGWLVDARHDLSCFLPGLPGFRSRNQHIVPASIEPVANRLLTTSILAYQLARRGPLCVLVHASQHRAHV